MFQWRNEKNIYSKSSFEDKKQNVDRTTVNHECTEKGEPPQQTKWTSVLYVKQNDKL